VGLIAPIVAATLAVAAPGPSAEHAVALLSDNRLVEVAVPSGRVTHRLRLSPQPDGYVTEGRFLAFDAPTSSARAASGRTQARLTRGGIADDDRSGVCGDGLVVGGTSFMIRRGSTLALRSLRTGRLLHNGRFGSQILDVVAKP
jgi:hypothetical protein